MLTYSTVLPISGERLPASGARIVVPTATMTPDLNALRVREDTMANTEKQIYKLAVQEAMRSLSQQQATLESLRGRAGVLLSAAMISTSFFGAQTIVRVGAGADPHPSADPFWAARGFANEVRQHVVDSDRRLDRLFILLSLGWVLFLAEILAWLAHARWG